MQTVNTTPKGGDVRGGMDLDSDSSYLSSSSQKYVPVS